MRYSLSRTLTVAIAVTSTLVVGCNERGVQQGAYQRIWVSSEQANPVLRVFGPLDPGNLSNTEGFEVNRFVVNQDAITDELESEMRALGFEPNLSGLGKLLTVRLDGPEDTPKARQTEAGRILSIRNIFFGAIPDKTVEFHHGPSRLEWLCLRKQDSPVRTCYTQKDGMIWEYLYTDSSAAPVE